jgi:protein involved in polysaccharide export with SLBB domain
MKTIFLALGLALLAAPGITNAQLTEAVIRPGDAIRIQVWRNVELSGEFLVSEHGQIQHPLYQGVEVAGATRSQLTERLRTFLTRYEANPQFVAIPLLKVGVGGEVRSPNLYRLPLETTIAEAVALAGGVTERGKIDQIHLIRGSEQRTIDLTSPSAEEAQLTVRSGDRILVSRQRNILREYVGPVASVLAAVGTFIRLSQ